MSSLLTTRNSGESNAVVRTATTNLTTQLSLFVSFMLRIQETWCLLQFNFSKNPAKITQYGLPATRIMIGSWRKCGFEMQTIKCIRSVPECLVEFILGK